MTSTELNLTAVPNYKCFLNRIPEREIRALRIEKKISLLNF